MEDTIEVIKAEKPKAVKPKKNTYAFPREGVTIEADSIEEALLLLPKLS